SEKSKAETKGNPQARVETPRATPTAHHAEAPRPRRRSCTVMLMGLLTVMILLAIGGGVAAYLLWPEPQVTPDQRPLAATVAQRVKAMPGGQADVDVTVDRGGYRGTVGVVAKALPATLRADTLNLAADQNAGKLLVTVSPTAPEGESEFTVAVQA